jgi:hypothetical protein
VGQAPPIAQLFNLIHQPIVLHTQDSISCHILKRYIRLHLRRGEAHPCPSVLPFFTRMWWFMQCVDVPLRKRLVSHPPCSGTPQPLTAQRADGRMATRDTTFNSSISHCRCIGHDRLLVLCGACDMLLLRRHQILYTCSYDLELFLASGRHPHSVLGWRIRRHSLLWRSPGQRCGFSHILLGRACVVLRMIGLAIAIVSLLSVSRPYSSACSNFGGFLTACLTLWTT